VKGDFGVTEQGVGTHTIRNCHKNLFQSRAIQTKSVRRQPQVCGTEKPIISTDTGQGEESDMALDVKEKIIEIIAEQAVLDPSDVSLDQTLEALGIDSLGLVESIFAIEEAFDITVPFNANEPDQSEFDISSVAAIVKAVQGLIEDQKA
jgi:acyl carrier protein